MKATKKKATFFNCSAEKRSSTLVSQFAYRRYGAEINAAIGGYRALYAWQLWIFYLLPSVVSPAQIKAPSWAERQYAYHLF